MKDRLPFSDQELREAAAEVREAMITSLLADSAMNHTFSLAFEAKMKRLIQREKLMSSFRTTIKQAAAVILILISLFTSCILINTDARAAFIKWIREVYEDVIQYSFFVEEEPSVSTMYQPTAIPNKYEAQPPISDGFGQTIVYINKEDPADGIIFYYYALSSDTTTSVVPSGSNKEVCVKKSKGHFYSSNDPSKTNLLIWIDEQQDIVFTLSAFLSEQEMLHIAESVKLY